MKTDNMFSEYRHGEKGRVGSAAENTAINDIEENQAQDHMLQLWDSFIVNIISHMHSPATLYAYKVTLTLHVCGETHLLKTFYHIH